MGHQNRAVYSSFFSLPAYVRRRAVHIVAAVTKRGSLVRGAMQQRERKRSSWRGGVKDVLYFREIQREPAVVIYFVILIGMNVVRHYVLMKNCKLWSIRNFLSQRVYYNYLVSLSWATTTPPAYCETASKALPLTLRRSSQLKEDRVWRE